MIHLHLNKNTPVHPINNAEIPDYHFGFEAPTPDSERRSVTLSGYEVSQSDGVGSLMLVTNGMPVGTMMYRRSWVTTRYDGLYDFTRGLTKDKILIDLVIKSLKDSTDDARSLLMRRRRVNQHLTEVATHNIADKIDLYFEGPAKNRMFDLLENVTIRDSIDRENRERWSLILQALIQTIMDSGETLEEFAKQIQVLYDGVLKYTHSLAERVRNALMEVNDMVDAPWLNFGDDGAEAGWALLKKAQNTIVKQVILDLDGACPRPFWETCQGARSGLIRLNKFLTKMGETRPEGEDLQESLALARSIVAGAARILYGAEIRERFEPANSLSSSIMAEIELDASPLIGLSHLTVRLKEARQKRQQVRADLAPSIKTDHIDARIEIVIKALVKFLAHPNRFNREQVRIELGALERSYLP